METSFNFLNQPILSALQDAAGLLPGLKQVDLLYVEQEKNSLVHKSLNADNKRERIDIDIDSSQLKRTIHFQRNLLGTRWYDPTELPFTNLGKKKLANTIFDEILKSVLCIGFPSPVNNGSDVFVFYFREDAGEFGPMREDKILETTQKIVIERLLFSSLKAIINNYSQNRTVMADLNKNIHQMVNAKQALIEKQLQEINSMKESMDAIINGILKDIKKEKDIVKITDKAMLLLRPYLSNISLLKDVLSKALNFAKTISFGLNSDELVLHESYFSNLNQKSINTELPSTQKADEYSVNTKMYRFLDSLEEAAQKLSINGVKLTSSNVGSILEQPVTAAAISDKLKNHGKKINLLLKQYPNQWKTIRQKFRPVVNIQERAAEFKVA